MDSIKIRELEEKSIVDPEDTMVVEDNSGTLQVPISSLQATLQASLYCGNINDLKQSVFNAGDIVETLGYHTIGDGGMATYVIVDAPDELDNGITIISLLTSDRLKAHLLYNDYVSPLQAGAYGDGVHDDTQVIEDMQSLGLPIKFPKKTFIATISLHETDKIDFNGCTIKSDDWCINASDNTIVENVTLGSTGDYALIIANSNNIIIRNCTFISYSENYAISVYNANGVTISECVFVEPSNAASTIIHIDNRQHELYRTTISKCNFCNIRSTAVDTSGYTTICNCIIKAASDAINYNIIAFNHCVVENSVLVGRPAVVANANSTVSLSNVVVDDAVNAVMVLNNAVVDISKLLDFTGEDKFTDSVIGQTSGGSKVYINGHIIKDASVYPYELSNATVTSFIENNSYDDALDAVFTVNGSDGIIDLRETLRSSDSGLVNVAIRFSPNTPSQLTTIKNGISGQVIALYGDGATIKIKERKGSDDIYRVDSDRLTLSPDVPLYLYYMNQAWVQIK